MGSPGFTLYACPLPPVATNKDGSPGTGPISQSSSCVSAYLTEARSVRRVDDVKLEYPPAHAGGDERLRACEFRVDLLKRFPELLSGFHGYTTAFCIPVGQGGAGRRDHPMVGLNVSGMTTTVDRHLDDVLGIGLGELY
jgi:hypothetical protein